MKEQPEVKKPTTHWASSEAEGGRCWCGEVASPEHARKANGPLRTDSAAPSESKACRQG